MRIENEVQVFHPHPKQEAALNSLKRIVVCCSGIQGGKSLLGAIKLRQAIKKRWPYSLYPQVNFAVCAPEYKTMIQSTRIAFDLIFQGMGQMNEMKQEYQLADGRKIFFRTMIKNPNAVEGIPSCVFIWGDEAGQYPRAAFINIQSRTAFMEGQAFFTTTPYAMNWVKKDVMDPWSRGNPDIDYFHWVSTDNPAFPKAEYERQKNLLSKAEFERKYMGLHTRMEGLIFEDWNADNLMAPEKVELGSVYGGIDWGFDHPMALSIRSIKNGQCIGLSFFKGSGLSTTQQLELIEAKTKLFNVRHWACGHDRPDMILELNNRKIPAFTYFDHAKQYKGVDAGNQKHAELIKTKQYKVVNNAAGLEELQDEYETYHWDKKEDETGIVKPYDANNDLMAAERYCTVGTLHLLAIPQEKIQYPLGYFDRKDFWKPSARRGSDG